jgi:3-deoxy-7-phosphoheptulonate synthase
MGEYVGRNPHINTEVVQLGNLTFGDGSFRVIAGPCAIRLPMKEYLETVVAVHAAGADALRGGADKWRTRVYDKGGTKNFNGIHEEAIPLIRRARELTGMPVFTEVTLIDHLEWAAQVADGIQLGAKNAWNDELLQEAGRTGKPILIKRGWDMSLEDINNQVDTITKTQRAYGHKEQVIIAERGIKSGTGHSTGKYTLDLQAVDEGMEISRWPWIVDTTHSAKDPRQVIRNMRLAAATGGAGIIVEVDAYPENAVTDAYRVITPEALQEMIPLMHQIRSTEFQMAGIIQRNDQKIASRINLKEAQRITAPQLLERAFAAD